MRISIGIVIMVAAGLTGCVSTYSTDPVMGANVAPAGEPQAFSVLMFDHPDETVALHSFGDAPPVAGR